MTGRSIAAGLAERARSRGLVIPPEDMAAVTAGATWLRDCMARLRQAGLTR